MREIKIPDFDINVVWYKINDMTKIKKGASPIGTKHHLVCYTGKGPAQVTYAVRAVTGTDTNIPGGDPVIYLAFAGGREQSFNSPQVYVSMPLSMLAQEAMPVTEADKFWADKGDKIENE